MFFFLTTVSHIGFPFSRLCHNYHFCHSVQAKRDTESSIFSKFWIPAFAGMTMLMSHSPIMTQSPFIKGARRRKDFSFQSK